MGRGTCDSAFCRPLRAGASADFRFPRSTAWPMTDTLSGRSMSCSSCGVASAPRTNLICTGAEMKPFAEEAQEVMSVCRQPLASSLKSQQHGHGAVVAVLVVDCMRAAWPGGINPGCQGHQGQGICRRPRARHVTSSTPADCARPEGLHSVEVLWSLENIEPLKPLWKTAARTFRSLGLRTSKLAVEEKDDLVKLSISCTCRTWWVVELFAGFGHGHLSRSGGKETVYRPRSCSTGIQVVVRKHITMDGKGCHIAMCSFQLALRESAGQPPKSSKFHRRHTAPVGVSSRTLFVTVPAVPSMVCVMSPTLTNGRRLSASRAHSSLLLVYTSFHSPLSAAACASPTSRALCPMPPGHSPVMSPV